MKFPKDTEYFDLFENLASIARKSAFIACRTGDISIDAQVEGLTRLEHEGDIIEHAIYDKLNMHLDHPFPGNVAARRNIQGLARNIDNIIDQLKKAFKHIKRTGLAVSIFDRQLGLIHDATSLIEETLPAFRTLQKMRGGRTSELTIQRAHKKLDRIEKDGDKLFDSALAQIEKKKRTCKKIIDWHCLDREEEVTYMLENALNQCEDVGSFMESLKLEKV